mmetsp:Transcript_125564/g.361006  ORF Transcript_125564/g.361006 Transcript_125564/m.361006 type:complete len:277 (+) Transcript_125564:772-1602(+)
MPHPLRLLHLPLQDFLVGSIQPFLELRMGAALRLGVSRVAGPRAEDATTKQQLAHHCEGETDLERVPVDLLAPAGQLGSPRRDLFLDIGGRSTNPEQPRHLLMGLDPPLLELRAHERGLAAELDGALPGDVLHDAGALSILQSLRDVLPTTRIEGSAHAGHGGNQGLQLRKKELELGAALARYPADESLDLRGLVHPGQSLLLAGAELHAELLHEPHGCGQCVQLVPAARESLVEHPVVRVREEHLRGVPCRRGPELRLPRGEPFVERPEARRAPR